MITKAEKRGISNYNTNVFKLNSDETEQQQTSERSKNACKICLDETETQ